MQTFLIQYRIDIPLVNRVTVLQSYRETKVQLTCKNIDLADSKLIYIALFFQQIKSRQNKSDY